MEKKKFTTTINSDILKEAKIYCIENDMSVNTLIELALEKYLKPTKKKKATE